MAVIDPLERKIYMEICRSDGGIKAKEIARNLYCDPSKVNHFLYASPFMKELCWQDDEYNWHGIIPQQYPHYGLAEFSGFYSTVREFVNMSEDRWMEILKLGCENIVVPVEIKKITAGSQVLFYDIYLGIIGKNTAPNQLSILNIEIVRLSMRQKRKSKAC